MSPSSTYFSAVTEILDHVNALKRQAVIRPAATGLQGAARYVGFSTRHFKSLVKNGAMPPGRATGTRSFIWLYVELDAALAKLPQQARGTGEPARLAAGKAAAKANPAARTADDRHQPQTSVAQRWSELPTAEPESSGHA